ncbi:MAG: hypothetical protein H7A52_02365 [Akkermansiaceae bacterium]|nr:hypothetical protein [Akkermansiaceae bacterium]
MKGTISFILLTVGFVSINQFVRMSAGFHYMIQNHSVEYPSKITENFAEWALELQPWWGFAGLHDPRASSSKGHWPIRRWFFTFSFQILGSVVSAAIYFILFFAVRRFFRFFRRRTFARSG